MRSRALGLPMVWVLVLMAACGSSGSKTKPAVVVTHESFTFQFGDVHSTGQLDYPTDHDRAPVVVLIPGSGPEDMDADIGTGPAPKSHIFLDIANYLTQRGYAVMRYNKRYVSGYNQADFASYYSKLDLPGMLADAGQVLRAAEADRHVDPRRVFLYGWSEGSTVAAALATTHPELAGIAFQGPVAEAWRDLFTYQVVHVGAPYLRRFAVDGKLGPDELKRAGQGGGGLVATEVVGFVAPKSRVGDFTVGPELDPDHDGKLDFDRDFQPGIQRLFDRAFAPGGPFAIYAPERALPSVADQAPKLSLPVLVLQGANDANVPPSGSVALDRALDQAGNLDHTLRQFPGLGHSLGRASSVQADDFQPVDQGPLAVIASWLDDHGR